MDTRPVKCGRTAVLGLGDSGFDGLRWGDSGFRAIRVSGFRV